MMLVYTFSELLFLVLWALVCALAVWLYLPIWWRQRHCKHDRAVNETQACEAICRDCGKNLGFIGAWQKQQAATRKDTE